MIRTVGSGFIFLSIIGLAGTFLWWMRFYSGVHHVLTGRSGPPPLECLYEHSGPCRIVSDVASWLGYRAARRMRHGDSLRKAATEAGISENHLRQFLKRRNMASRKGKRWTIYDRRPREVPVLTNGRLSIVKTDLKGAEAAGQGWAVQGKALSSRIHRRKPKGKSMPVATARANAAKSSIGARVEHVFAHQKNKFGLFIRTIGIKRAEAKLTLANLAYNFDRLDFYEKRAIMG